MKQDATSYRRPPFLRMIAAGLLLPGILLLVATQSQAALIGVQAGIPDLQVTGLNVSYQVTPDGAPNQTSNLWILNNSVFSGSYFDGVSSSSVSISNFDFQVNLDTNGNFSAGTLALYSGGSIGGTDGTVVVSGMILNFGFEFASGQSSSSAIFDGTYSIDASALGTAPFPVGEIGNFIFTASLPANTSGWDVDFAGTALADVTGPVVPVPSTLTLMAFALLGAYRLRRRA